MTDVLEHLEDPVRIIIQALDSIKESGCILYYFSENRVKAGHLSKSTDMKPVCDQMLDDNCNLICSLDHLPSAKLWRKRRRA